jgi:hypothetical protein
MISDIFKMLYWLLVNICNLTAYVFKLLWRLVTS